VSALNRTVPASERQGEPVDIRGDLNLDVAPPLHHALQKYATVAKG
jgi:hypothetical protein